MTTTSASSSSSVRSLRSPPCQSACLSDGANLSISRSQLVTTLVGATMSALNGLRRSAFSSSAFTARRSASAWTVLPSPMSSARTPPEPISWRNQSQWKPCSWYGRSEALRLRGFFVPLISSMSRSFWKSSLAPSADVRRARPARAAPGCARPARAGACPPALRRWRGSRPGAGAPRAPSRRRAARTSRRRGGRTAAPRRGSVASSSCVTATPSLSNVRRSDSQSTPLDTRALALSVSLAHLHVDEIVGDEEVPLLGELADALGPELDRVVAARDEAVAVLVGHEAEVAELARGCLLGGDVAPDAARSPGAARRRRARAACRAACSGGGLTITGGVMPSARTSISTSS